jgi:hypothetical protein
MSVRFPTFILTVFALVASAFGADAATYKTPQALIEAIYAYDTSESETAAPSPYGVFFSKGLNALFQKDRDGRADDEIGAVDFDPVIGGQDGAAENVKPGEPIIIDSTAELEVTFTNGGAMTLYYTLVRENGGWKVDDIANQQGEFPWSLRDLLTSQPEQ